MTVLKLRKPLAAAPFPALAPWLAPSDQSDAARVVRRASGYLGTLETSPNRGEHIDRWLRWANVPESLIVDGKGNWCGAFAGGVLREEGLRCPQDYANCDAWVPFIVPNVTPRPGDLVLFGVGKDARHIEIVALHTIGNTVTIGGNRSWGAGTSNNGVAVDIGPIVRRDILGFIPLEAFAAGAS